jgi:transcriptional regulator with XRE-family HTH domain
LDGVLVDALDVMAKKPNPPSKHNVPGLLRRLREEAGLTQRDLAKRMKRAQPWIHKSEIGERRVDVSELLDWCAACDTDAQKALQRVSKPAS